MDTRIYLERVERIELSSQPWQGRIIATIRYARRCKSWKILISQIEISSLIPPIKQVISRI